MHSWVSNHALQDSNGQLLSCTNNAIQLTAVPAMAKIKLQCVAGEPFDSGDLDRSMINMILPKTPLEQTGPEEPIFWLAPNEWLLVSANRQVSVWRQELSRFFPGDAHAIVDLSDSLTVIELAGEQSVALLAQGCGINFDRQCFAAGRYASTRLFELPALIHRVNGGSVFHIYANRCDALYLWHILERQAI